MTIPEANLLLDEGVAMLENVENSTKEFHKTLEYVEEAMDKLKQAGKLVHDKYPSLVQMISYAQAHTPTRFHNNINHAWSGIGDWYA
jgi:hypothetical protein